MAINSVSSGSNYVSQVQPQPQTEIERLKAEQEESERNNKNKDVAAQINDTLKPTTNNDGQSVGAIINVKA